MDNGSQVPWLPNGRSPPAPSEPTGADVRIPASGRERDSEALIEEPRCRTIGALGFENSAGLRGTVTSEVRWGRPLVCENAGSDSGRRQPRRSSPGASGQRLCRTSIRPAEGLAYFFLFSLFPLLIVLTSLLGTVSGGAEIRGELLRYLRTALPPTASRLVESTLAELAPLAVAGNYLGIPGAFASAGAGMVAIIEGLNTAYNVREAWPWLKRRAVALVLTQALSLFSLAALGIFIWHAARQLPAESRRCGHTVQNPWYILQWPVAAMLFLPASR